MHRLVQVHAGPGLHLELAGGPRARRRQHRDNQRFGRRGAERAGHAHAGPARRRAELQHHCLPHLWRP